MGFNLGFRGLNLRSGETYDFYAMSFVHLMWYSWWWMLMVEMYCDNNKVRSLMSHRACCHTCYTIKLYMCMSSVCVWCSCLLVICLQSWVRIITQYVAACVCHLCVFGVLVCWWSAWRSPTDKNTKHTQMTYTCSHILRNNMNSTNANQREE